MSPLNLDGRTYEEIRAGARSPDEIESTLRRQVLNFRSVVANLVDATRALINDDGLSNDAVNNAEAAVLEAIEVMNQ